MAVAAASAVVQAPATAFPVGRMAFFDTTQTPPVVIDVYNWVDPSYMTGPAWVDVSSIVPPVVNGCTYSGGVWSYPTLPENMVRVVQDQIAINNAFLALGNPTALQTERQCQALTYQVNRWLLRRIGGQ